MAVRTPSGPAPRICIVGAGVIGLTAALRLQRARAQVTLIDSNPSRAASLAAAGMLGACAEAMHEAPGGHPSFAALGFEALEAWEELLRAFPGFAPFRSTTGSTLIAFEAQDMAGVARAYDRARAYGVSHVWQDGGAGIDARFAPALASLFLPQESRIEAVPMLNALAQACREVGVQVVFGAGVTAVTRRDAMFDLVLDQGDVLRADEVILATGAKATLAASAPSLSRLIPAKGMLGLCTAQNGPLWPFVLRTPRFYAFATNDDAICFGATSQPGRDDLEPDPEALAIIDTHLKQAAPGFALDRPRVLSVGVRPLSPDHAPMIGRDDRDGPIVAIGHGRNGWLLAPLTARMLEAHVFKKDTMPLWAAFQPDRFAS